MGSDLLSARLELLARVYSNRHYALYKELDRSLDPRAPEMLFDVAAEFVGPGSTILDVGCRAASHLIRLVREHGARGVGLDPLTWHVEQAEAAVREAGLQDRVEIVRGVVEEIPRRAESFDFVWCRDVLELVVDLEQGLREIRRVLRPDGRVLIYTVFATELLEAGEAQRLNGPLGNVAANMDERQVGQAFSEAGLRVEVRDVVGTEWREFEEERTRPVSESLLHLARLRRRREAFVSEFGEELFQLAEASLHWLPYLILGKLKPVMYILSRA